MKLNSKIHYPTLEERIKNKDAVFAQCSTDSYSVWDFIDLKWYEIQKIDSLQDYDPQCNLTIDKFGLLRYNFEREVEYFVQHKYKEYKKKIFLKNCK